MKEQPILFSAPMVRAIMNGTKTQTRRPFYVPTGNAKSACWDNRFQPPRELLSVGKVWTVSNWRRAKPGDRLWVRETWASDDGRTAWYRADGETYNAGLPWKPSIHMPRWASRITLEITGVRVERLRDISEADAIAEGIEKTASGWWSLYGQASSDGTYSPRASYRALWESINGPGSWDLNPWVWVVEFKRTTP